MGNGDFPPESGLMRAKFLCTENLAFLLKRIMQPEQLRRIAKEDGEDFGIIVVGNADRRRDSKSLEQVRDRIAVSDDERVAF